MPQVRAITELDHTSMLEISNPATRSVELFANDIRLYGFVRPETSQVVIDEELTNAAEDIAYTKSKYAVVPRAYYQRGEDLVDIYENSLKQVLQDGLDWCGEDLQAGKPGAIWELERRRADQTNLNMIIDMQPSSVCVEISSTPLDKPEHERITQGYNGMTHIRVSAKDCEGIVKQYNFMLPSSEPAFLLNLQCLLGVSPEEQTTDSQQLLERPIIRPDRDDETTAIKELENLIGMALLASEPDRAVLRMVQKSVSARRESWAFVSSEEHAKLREELNGKIAELASIHPNWWQNGMGKIRSGFLKELRERYDGKIYGAKCDGLIQAAAARAMVDSDVFITCGGTVEATTLSNNTSVSGRSLTVDLLRNEVKGNGACTACGAKGRLYGCGFCKECNNLWCDKYESTGEQLSETRVRYLKHMRPVSLERDRKSLDVFEQLSVYWQNLTAEVKQKQQAQRLHAERLRQAEKEK